MAAPEINVRLTADGVQDVVNAFRRVQQETRKTKEETDALGEAMGQLKSLIPVISIGAVVTELVSMGKAAFDSAVDLGKLAEKTGASAGDLSVLAMTARDCNVNQESLGKAMGKLSKNMYDTAHGTGTAKAAFKELGISLQDIKSKNASQMFVEIAQKMAAMPDGPKKTALAIELFGKSGTELLPIIAKIGQANGFEEQREKAQKFGVYISDDLEKQIEEANGALKDMEEASRGFANQFLAGFVPDMTDAMKYFSESVAGTGGNGFVLLGQIAGRVLQTILHLTKTAAKGIYAVSESLMNALTSAWNLAESIWNSAKAPTMSGRLSGIVDAFKNTGKSMMSYQKMIWQDNGKEIKNSAGQLAGDFTTNPFVPLPKSNKNGDKGGKDTGMDGTGISAEDAKKAAEEAKKRIEEYQKLVEARVNFEDAAGNTELQKQKARDELAEIQDKSRYDAGLMTLKDYYDARARRIQAETSAEENLLQVKLANEEAAVAKLLGKSPAQIKTIAAGGAQSMEKAVSKASPDTQEKALAMLQKVAETQAQIDEAKIKRERELAENEDSRHTAEKDASDKLLEDRQKLYELTGDTAKQQQLALDKELKDTDELLRRLGVTASERAALMNKVRTETGAKNTFSNGLKRGNAVFGDMQEVTGDIEEQAYAGQISQVSAEAQILKAERERLPVLREIASQLQTQLDKLDPQSDTYAELKKQLDDYKKNVDKINVSLTKTKTFSVELSNQMSTVGLQAFTNFFDEIGSGSKSFSDSLESMGETFEKVIEHMISEMIVYYTLMAAIGWLNELPGVNLDNAYDTLTNKGAFGSGFADGGYTGSGSTTAAAGVVHGKEYVLNANATSKYGVAFLDAMNKGSVGFVASTGTYSSLMSDTAAETSADDQSSAVEVNIQNNTGQTATATRSTGSNGQSVISVIVGQVAQDIASGGKVGQAIQTNYGVTRKGVMRG